MGLHRDARQRCGLRWQPGTHHCRLTHALASPHSHVSPNGHALTYAPPYTHADYHASTLTLASPHVHALSGTDSRYSFNFASPGRQP